MGTGVGRSSVDLLGDSLYSSMAGVAVVLLGDDLRY